METRIQKWGNSLAIRIPKSLAIEVGLEQDTPVEVVLDEGRIILKPVLVPVLKLEDLLAQVTVENVHHEVDFGAAVGQEVG